MKDQDDNLKIWQMSYKLLSAKEKWQLICKLLEKFNIDVQKNVIYLYLPEREYNQIEEISLMLNQLTGEKFHTSYSISNNCWAISPESYWNIWS